MEDSIEDLLIGIEDGDAESFMKLIRFVEDNYRKVLYTMGYVELGDYILIKSCTYILLSNDGMAYALLNGDKPEVISIELLAVLTRLLMRSVALRRSDGNEFVLRDLILRKIYIMLFSITYMGSTVILTVRVRRELKEKAEQLGINIREVVERALEEAIEEREMEKLREMANELKELLGGISGEEVVRLIREDRDAR